MKELRSVTLGLVRVAHPVPARILGRAAIFSWTPVRAFKNKDACPMPIRLLLILLFCAALCSCASVSVRKMERLTENPPTTVPLKFLVRPFAFHDPGVRVDRSGARLDAFKYDLQEKFTRNLVKRLPKYIAPAEAIAATAPLPRGNYWLIEGRFDRVNQGSRMLRSVVGFGFGGTKMDTSVLVYDLSGPKPRPFLLIETTGGSNAAPGAIGTVTYFMSGVTALGSAANLLEGVRSGVTFDTIRTTREVAATVGYYSREEQGLEQPAPPKRLGKISYWPFTSSKPSKPTPQMTGTVTVTPAE